MNKVILIGRLTAMPELKQTGNNIAVCQFSVAVDRKYKIEGQPTSDFIPVVAWRKTAEFVAKYFVKGSRIAVVGSIQMRSYEDKDGNKRYVTEVIADEVEFCESKGNKSLIPANPMDRPIIAREEAGYYDGVDDDLPKTNFAANTTTADTFFADDDCPF